MVFHYLDLRRRIRNGVCLGSCYASAVYPATGNLHDEIGVLGVSSTTTGRASAPPNCLNSAAFPSIAVVVVVVVGNFMK